MLSMSLVDSDVVKQSMHLFVCFGYEWLGCVGQLPEEHGVEEDAGGAIPVSAEVGIVGEEDDAATACVAYDDGGTVADALQVCF